jgi:hypothetical protein
VHSHRPRGYATFDTTSAAIPDVSSRQPVAVLTAIVLEVSAAKC